MGITFFPQQGQFGLRGNIHFHGPVRADLKLHVIQNLFRGDARKTAEQDHLRFVIIDEELDKGLSILEDG